MKKLIIILVLVELLFGVLSSIISGKTLYYARSVIMHWIKRKKVTILGVQRGNLFLIVYQIISIKQCWEAPKSK